MPQTEGPKDIIAELSGVDSRHRISSKYAAREILVSGQFLFDVVLDKSISEKGNLAVRCAEACAIAADKQPGFAAANSEKIVTFILGKPCKELRYFFSYLLIHAKVAKKDSVKCAKLLKKWINDETGKGPRACYMEAISSLAEGNSALAHLASKLLEEALHSPVPSYSARARQIVMRLKKKSKKS